MKKVASVSVVSGLILALFILCGPFVNKATAETKTIKIGLVTSMTGMLAAPYMPMLETLKPLKELFDKRGGITIKGQKYSVEVIAQDDQSTPPGAVSAVNRLIQDGAKFIIAPMFPPNYLAIEPIVEESKIVTVLSLGAVPDFVGTGKRYTFGAHTYVYMPPVAIDYLKKHYPKVTKIAMLSPDDPGAILNISCAEKEAKARGLDIVFQERFKMGSEDFYPVLTRLLQKKPDAIDVVLSIEPWAAAIINQSRELGFTGPVYASAGLLGDINIVKKLITEKYQYDLFHMGPDMQSPNMPAIVKDFRTLVERDGAKNPFQTSHVAVLDGAYTIVQGIEKAQSLDPDTVVQAMENMKTIDTTCGKGRMAGKEFFGANHVVRRPIAVSGILNGKVFCEFSSKD
jgi:branched-chain amino acid transport system substrate-binding protein